MSSSFLGLRTTIYKVSDINKAKAWYAEILDVAPYFDEPFYVGFNVAGYELGLQPDPKNDAKADGVITYWGVDNVQDMYKMLLSKGATAYEEPTEVGGDIEVAAVKDLWGNVFGIIYNPEFSLA